MLVKGKHPLQEEYTQIRKGMWLIQETLMRVYLVDTASSKDQDTQQEEIPRVFFSLKF